MSTVQKIRNWKEYNAGLKQRGNLLFRFQEEYLETLYFKGEQQRGGVRKYTPQMYEYVLNIKVMLRLPWRATLGLAQELLKSAFEGQDIDVPDYAHAARAVGRLKLTVKPVFLKKGESLELAFDSTGVNVYSTSGYHQRKYGKEGWCRKRDQWKKVHIALEINTGQVLSMAYTDSNTNDCEVVDALSHSIQGNVKSVRADGAYDTEGVYRIIEKWNAKALIPPACTCKAQDELRQPPKVKKSYLKQRDATIKTIRRYKDFAQGLKEWKVTSGYHRRSLIEAYMFRLKRIFGFHLHHKTDSRRQNEMIAKINVLNRMTALGRAEYAPI